MAVQSAPSSPDVNSGAPSQTQDASQGCPTQGSTARDRALRESALGESFLATRQQSLAHCAPLHIEDYGLQAAPFASPPKWHLAHTSWFFETFILKPFMPGYSSVNPHYEVLFNSYYNGIGEQHPRERRGLLSRPSLEEVHRYREQIDAAMLRLLDQADHPAYATITARCRLGIEHERQHQELFFTDIKYSLAANPLLPAYTKVPGPTPGQPLVPLQWSAFAGGLVEIGHRGEDFCFDNELPRHRVHLEPFELANRLVSNSEFQDFVDDGGYRRPEFWLADGWAAACREGWTGPLHWHDREGEALEFTLYGLQPRAPAAPVCHVSGFEADAYARWAGYRLPREPEWERAAALQGDGPSVCDQMPRYHPPAMTEPGLQALYGSCWQWTQSAYSAYPGFRAASDAIGEYNGKFMSNQWILRGGSCVTSPSQSRPSYRNFFYPQDRWQFSGIRLAR